MKKMLTVAALLACAPVLRAEINDGKDEYQMLKDEAAVAEQPQPAAEVSTGTAAASSGDYLAAELSKNIAAMDVKTVLYNLDTISELTAGPAARKAYMAALARRESAVKIMALKLVGQYHDAEAESLVIKQFETGDAAVRLAAVGALAKINGVKTRLILELTARDDDDSRVRAAAAAALKDLPEPEKTTLPSADKSKPGPAESGRMKIAPNTTFSNKKGPKGGN